MAAHDRGEDLPESLSIAKAQETMEKAQSVLAFIESNNLVGCEAAMYLLHHGAEVQRVAVARELQFYATREDELSKLLTLVTALITNGDTTVEFQQSCLIGLEKLLGGNNADGAIGVRYFDRILRAAEVVDRTIVDGWVGLVRLITAKMDEHEVMGTALPWLQANIAPDQTRGRQRLLAANMCSALLSSMPDVVAPKIWKQFFALSTDSSSHVRLTIVSNLRVLASALGPGTTRTVLFPQLVKLMLDDNPQVAGGFFEFLLDLHDFFEPQFEAEVLVPVLFGYIENDPPAAVLEYVARGVGRMAHQFKLNTSPQTAERICRAYKQFALANLDIQRQHAAYNAPAMILEFREHSALLQDLVETVGMLATDSNAQVRARIGAGFEKLCSLLPTTHIPKARETLRSLFMDTDVEVQRRIAESLPSLCRSFMAHMPNETARQQFIASALSFISGYETKIRANWRKVKSLLDGFNDLMTILSPADIASSLLPILCSHMTYGAAALKDQCADLIIGCLRRCVDLKADKTIINAACTRALKLAASTSSHARAAFIILTIRFARELRDESFIACFEQILIRFYEDPIYSVRRRLAMSLGHYPKELREVLMDGLTVDADASVREACRQSRRAAPTLVTTTSPSTPALNPPPVAEHHHHQHNGGKRGLDSIAGAIAKIMKELSA